MSRIKPSMLAACSLLLIAVLVGCAKKTEETSSTSHSERTQTTTTDVSVTEVNLGRTVGSDKRVTDAVTTFNPNDVIYASIVTSGSSPNTTLQVRWTYQDGQVIEESQQTIAATDETVTEFHISKPDGWPAGKYKAEVFVNGDLVETKDFEVNTTG